VGVGEVWGDRTASTGRQTRGSILLDSSISSNVMRPSVLEIRFPPHKKKPAPPFLKPSGLMPFTIVIGTRE
jgi:hypothetical protein